MKPNWWNVSMLVSPSGCQSRLYLISFNWWWCFSLTDTKHMLLYEKKIWWLESLFAKSQGRPAYLQLVTIYKNTSGRNKMLQDSMRTGRWAELTEEASSMEWWEKFLRTKILAHSFACWTIRTTKKTKKGIRGPRKFCSNVGGNDSLTHRVFSRYILNLEA